MLWRTTYYDIKIGDSNSDKAITKKVTVNELKDTYGFNSNNAPKKGDSWDVVLLGEVKEKQHGGNNTYNTLYVQATELRSEKDANNVQANSGTTINVEDLFKTPVEVAKDIEDTVSSLLLKALKILLNSLLNLLRFIPDALQVLANSIQTVPNGTFLEFKLTYSYDKLEKDVKEDSDGKEILGDKNKYTNVKDAETKEKKEKWQKQTTIDEEYFNRKTKIPVIPVDVYNIAMGNIDILDVNFLVPDGNENKTWIKIRNFATKIIHIVLYVAAACLITSLIWNGIHLARGSLTPESRREHLEGLHRFVISLLMLVGTIVIMAIGIYFSEMFMPKISSENKDELPIRVKVKNAEYSFSTNPTGYVRYMTEIDDTDLLGQKAIYIGAYFIIAILNFIAAMAMLVRMVGMLVLAVMGPIIATLHVLKLDENMHITYRDWVSWYLSLAAIQLIFALACRVILDIAVN